LGRLQPNAAIAQKAQIARTPLHAQDAIARKPVVQNLNPEVLGSLETEDELLEAAVSLTR
jgi:hypothetical protein